MKVSGTVYDGEKRPLSGYPVAAYHGDVNLKKERKLSQTETDDDGFYLLELKLARYPLGLNVRVAVLRGKSTELWTSPIHYNAKNDLVIDAEVSDAALGISEYQRLTDEISPLLQGASIAELQPSQIAYLAGRSAVSQSEVNVLVSAARLHTEIPDLSEEASYALLSQGLSARVDGLLALTRADWQAALDAADRGNVASLSRAKKTAAIAALNERKAAEALQPSVPGISGPVSFATVALKDSGKQERIAELAARHNGVNDAFWRAVERDRSITAGERDKLSNYATVGEILGNDPELLRRVAAHLTERGEEITPGALATINASELDDMIEDAVHADAESPLSGIGANELRTYAGALAAEIAGKAVAAFPTDALRADLSAMPTSGYFGQYRKGLNTFFTTNGGFDVRDDFSPALDSAPGRDPFRGIANKGAVKERVGTMTRLFRVLPEAAAQPSVTAYSGANGSLSRIATLADNGFESSAAIAATPRPDFVAQLSGKAGNPAYWGQVYDRAIAMRDIASLKGIELLHAYRQPFGVIQSLREAPEQAGTSDWRTLFGSLDMCDCDECASITSPAAYLADVLNFLGTDLATTQASPYDVLIARRPDIPHILLNCDNANRALPYIDLVNELLEDEVLRATGKNPIWAPYKRVQLSVQPAVLDRAASDDAREATVAKRTLVKVLNKELPGYGFNPAMDVAVVTRAKKPARRWHLFAHGWLVELTLPAAGKRIEVDYISRQTFGTEAELAANPAFRNPRATATLEASRFPLSLPPGLPLLETRLFLSHLQVPRERLIKLLAPQDLDGWAIEYLGLSAEEAGLVTRSAGVSPAEAWGFHAVNVTEDDVLVDPADSTELLTGRWSELLRRVDVLIARAGISYIELLDLLVTDFVNPPVVDDLRRVTIESTDKSDPATCDLSKLRLAGSIGSEAAPISLSALHGPTAGDIGAQGDLLDRLVRFLRLKRRTGWTARDLDLAIRQVRPGILDGQTLKSLAALRWTKTALRLGHAEACALFGEIDTRSYVDHGADEQPTLPSQYEGLFQNRAITNPVDSNFELDDAGTGLRKAGLTPADGKATVAAAFRITEEEVILLAQQTGISELTLQSLSELYRRVLFARGFRLSIQEMVWLEGLAGPLPSGDQIPDFVEWVQVLLGSKVSVADARFLLRGADAETAHLEPRDDEIAETLGELRAELQKIRAEHQTDPLDSDGAQLRKRLGELDWGAPLIDDLVGAVTDTKSYSADLTSLPAAVRKLLDPGPGDPVGVPVQPAISVPDKVQDLVAFDSDRGRLRALRELSRSDRKRLLLASSVPRFRRAVELLFALGKLSYDKDSRALSCRGLLPADGVTELVKLSQIQAYRDAIHALADQQQQALHRKLRYCTLPRYELDLDTTTFDLPADLAAYVYYDPPRKKLVIRGQLTDAEQRALEQGATPPLPQATVQALPTGQGGGAQPVDQADLHDLLVTSQNVDGLFDPPIGQSMRATTEEISGALLAKLTPYAGDVLSRRAVVNSLSGAFGLAPAVMRDLIEVRLPSATGSPRMTDAFVKLADSDPRASVDPAHYAGTFDDYRRLSKIALLFQRLMLEEAGQLPWVFDYAAKGGWLSAADLTSGAATGGADLQELSELVRLFSVSERAPYSDQLVDELLHLADDPASTFDDVIHYVRDHSTWVEEDLRKVCQILSLSTPADFIDAKALDDLRQALRAVGQLGATAAEALELTKSALGDADAMLAKSLAKSKHDPERWLEIVKPVNDTLREARRAALVDYLVANTRRAVGSGFPLWHDADSLYDYLLVDVQMEACMTTSRIRLALSSAQLFVQRCLMNLEPHLDVNSDPEARGHWNEWELWRKLYRVWEANRKVFLYPEDWIEPELRDDKTPFFKELEDELLQDDVTKEKAEEAFLHYLQKLEHVGKLEVMGMYIEEAPPPAPPSMPFALAQPQPANRPQIAEEHSEISAEERPETPADETEAGYASASVPTFSKRTLHVVARTSGEPHDWFYRKLTTTGEWHEGIWSPWEKVEADITGDHVLPVVLNHHLYLFWALFDKKADRPTKQELGDKESAQEPKSRWYIKFAWSEYRDGRWSPKRVSKEALKTPSAESSERPISEMDFSFKTEIANGGFRIKCYGPNYLDPVPAQEEKEDVTTTPPEGTKLTNGNRTANCGIWLRDNYNQWATNLHVLVYQNGRKIATLDSRDGNGFVEVWALFGGAQWWRDSQVELRMQEKVFEIVPLQPAPTDWYFPRDYSRRNGFDPLYAQVQVVDNLPEVPTLTEGPKVHVPGLTEADAAMSRIGRFDFEQCRGDLSPTEEALGEKIPELESGTSHDSIQMQGMMYVAEEAQTAFLRRSLLDSKGGRYRVLMPHQSVEPDIRQPFFFQDESRVFLSTLPQPSLRNLAKTNGQAPAGVPVQHRFDVFYHPYTCDFIASVNREGVDELLTLRSQALDDMGATFEHTYSPSSEVQLRKSDRDGRLVPVTREYVDFERSGSYSIYNWELFFHAPLLIAARLSANQRFEEARGWLHYIFDPTTRPGAFSPGHATKPTQRFWNVRPFWEAEGRDIHSIDDLLKGAEDLGEQYAEWREEPFKPYVVARLRQTAFMQSVVMRYLDNLLDWGDQQFSRFTMESTNEAALLYTLAAEILGRRPEMIPPRARPVLQTYLSLQQQAAAAPASLASDTWRDFSDLMVEIEGYIAPAAVPAGDAVPGSGLGRMWAFCVPSNGNLLQYWTRVADRLFKLRHCQDIEGVARKIPLWDPPIDPALLVRAAAAGVDLASVLSDINAALPNYRFTAMLSKALELCAQLRSFGAELLSALEKKDGEELGRLRSRHEVDLLKAVRTVKSDQLAESTQLRMSAEKSKVTVEARRDYYRDIPFLIPAEQAGLALSAVALNQETVAAASDTLAAIAAWVPQFSGGTSGFYSSPVVVTSYGGEQVSRGASAAASQARSIAAVLSGAAAASQTAGGYQRRQDEWRLQETLANRELDQIQKQIDAAGIREAIAQAELDAHDQQTDQAKAVDEYLREKYTNQELYGWLQGQLSSLYFQAYKLAFDVARKTERAFRHDLGLQDSDFVRFGYWDSLKSGLLAGERLESDLHRMEAAYLDQNRREFEITKHVSLAALDPAALLRLKNVGSCEVEIPEWQFDMDYPGHYLRRIKSVALSIPAVAGPYTNVNCTLTQSFSKVRKDTVATDYEDADHFHESFGRAETIVTSTARDDSGLFQLDFRDERYLPFEGTGAIGRWQIRLPRETNHFDVGTVSDVILHIRYTARDGGEELRQAALEKMTEQLRTGVRLFDVQTDFASEWYRFKHPEPGQRPKLVLDLGDEHFPFHSSKESVHVDSVHLTCAVDEHAAPSLTLNVSVGDKTREYPLAAGTGPEDMRSLEKQFDTELGEVVISGKSEDVANITELVLLCSYTLESKTSSP